MAADTNDRQEAGNTAAATARRRRVASILVLIVDVGHDSMLETRWRNVAERIPVWLGERKL